MTARLINGIGAGTTPGIGAAVACKLYFLYERGFYTRI